jgi:dienelactone hydrolase
MHDIRRRRRGIVGALTLAGLLAARPAVAQSVGIVGPDTIDIASGSLRLRALLWRPASGGPHPAILFNHGSGPAQAMFAPHRLALGPAFAREGFVFLLPFRRGAGLSAGQGENSYDVMRRSLASGGQDARNAVQLRLLEHDDIDDARAALALLRRRPDVDPRRIAVVGHSFGGSLTVLLAERDDSVRAAVVFGGAAGSWDGSPPLQARLRRAVARTTVPILFVHAENDYSVQPGRALAAEMERNGRPASLKIYPPVGTTALDGHNFVFLGLTTWAPDVFTFLRTHLGAPSAPR